jgi:hypothetical protein
LTDHIGGFSGFPIAELRSWRSARNTSTGSFGQVLVLRRPGVPLVIALVVVLILLCVSGLFIWARLAASNTRIIGAPDSELEDFFWGGVMCRHVITSGSLARLEFYDWGIRLRGIPISRWIIPTWEARYEEMSIAELVALPQSRIAVWFRLRGDSATIAFLCERSSQILPVLEKHGVPVNRAVTRIRRVEELYR